MKFQHPLETPQSTHLTWCHLKMMAKLTSQLAEPQTLANQKQEAKQCGQQGRAKQSRGEKKKLLSHSLARRL